jgi:pSer/pThr/pTyr-binding forkhead associated (FHA) protein
MPTLLALSIGPDISVEHAPVIVGRHPRCDARLSSLRVSRWHCLLTGKGGEVVVRDLGSTNGTWINGRRVEAGRLEPGDEIAIAHIRYLLGEAATLCAAEAERPARPEDGSRSARSSDARQ